MNEGNSASFASLGRIQGHGDPVIISEAPLFLPEMKQSFPECLLDPSHWALNKEQKYEKQGGHPQGTQSQTNAGDGHVTDDRATRYS